MKMPPSVREHKFSNLLSNDENLQVFKLLGNRCQSICTTVAQLFNTEPPHHTHWLKKDVGILCFVKDNIKKNYFFRLFCLRRNSLIWEHEMYNNMEYMESTTFFHIFEGEDGMVAFNFACTNEAKDFRVIVDQKILIRKKREEKRLRQSRESVIPKTFVSQDPFDYRKTTDPAVKAAKRKRNITKADIGSPLDFKHISHVGWHPELGFDVDSDDAQLKSFFEKAGVSDKQLQDRDTREFIYDFINKHGGPEAVVEKINNNARKAPATPTYSPAPVPPVPPRGAVRSHVRAAPPPPPSNNNSLKSPITNNCIDEGNEKFVSSDFAPPCPPPLPTSMPPPLEAYTNSPVPAAPQLGSALLDSIKTGTTLKHVEETKVAPVDDSRNDLLSEIRKGLRLKPVCEREVKPVNNVIEQGGGDLAGALARALAERSKAIHSEDDDDDDEDDDSNDDEWD